MGEDRHIGVQGEARQDHGTIRYQREEAGGRGDRPEIRHRGARGEGIREDQERGRVEVTVHPQASEHVVSLHREGGVLELCEGVQEPDYQQQTVGALCVRKDQEAEVGVVLIYKKINVILL